MQETPGQTAPDSKNQRYRLEIQRQAPGPREAPGDPGVVSAGPLWHSLVGGSGRGAGRGSTRRGGWDEWAEEDEPYGDRPVGGRRAHARRSGLRQEGSEPAGVGGGAGRRRGRPGRGRRDSRRSRGRPRGSGCSQGRGHLPEEHAEVISHPGRSATARGARRLPLSPGATCDARGPSRAGNQDRCRTSARRSRKRPSTSSGTKFETSPPKRATSFTSRELV